MHSHLVKQPPDLPTSDKRWKIIAATMRRHGYAPDALIETLHSVQEAFGFVDEDALRFVATALRVPYSRVYGVVTFYHYFTLKPQGEHTFVMCTGTACYIKGGSATLAAVEHKHGIKPGETTEDGKLSLLTARCIGSCGLAPAGVFDGEVVGKVTSEEALRRIQEWVRHDA